MLPNFPLRFDPRYREIWRAWLELRNLTANAESEWMWQHRTFLELLGLRAAMKLHDAARRCPGGGNLSHGPVLGAAASPNQGRRLRDEGVGGTFGSPDGGQLRAIGFRSGGRVDALGAVADAGPGAEIWWDAPESAEGRDCRVGELPWTQDHAWDVRLEDWAAKVTSGNG